MTTHWRAQYLEGLRDCSLSRLPVRTDVAAAGLLPDLIYWDMWPVQDPAGCIVSFDGQELWMILAAERDGSPHERHLKSHIRWLRRDNDEWIDLGRVLPDFGASYEREWSGSALLEGASLSLFFTGAGLSGHPGGYEQNLFVATAEWNGSVQDLQWSQPSQIIEDLPDPYLPATDHDGEPGKIRALRDPAFFRDPADGQNYIAFTASMAGASSSFNGMFGLAVKAGSCWRVLPPIIHAEAVNNELERAHIVHHQGRYYAFWATQTHTFSDDLQHAPTGLYGMVADAISGPFAPLNGTGLVVANPVSRPCNYYSWYVSADLRVCSFLDYPNWSGSSPPELPSEAEAQFAGLPAPIFRLRIDGQRCGLAVGDGEIEEG